MGQQRGVLITFEGCEGSGKTTQAERLGTYLREQGFPVTEVREPGSTMLGGHLREYLKSSQPLCPEAELMLFSAARAQMMRERVLPALEQGIHVISDRYADSTHAYQGGGRGIDADQITVLNEMATYGTRPGLTVLLDAPLKEIMKRLSGPQMALFGQHSGTRKDLADERRFESEQHSFHRRVQKRYTEIAKREPMRWLVLDALEDPDKLARQVRDRAAEVLSG